MAAGKESQSKYLKTAISFFGLGTEGVIDFGKFAVEKLKTKKDPADIESKGIFINF